MVWLLAVLLVGLGAFLLIWLLLLVRTHGVLDVDEVLLVSRSPTGTECRLASDVALAWWLRGQLTSALPQELNVVPSHSHTHGHVVAVVGLPANRLLCRKINRTVFRVVSQYAATHIYVPHQLAEDVSGGTTMARLRLQGE